ncbi:S8 family peptidase [Aquiflexum lacus]|uniref:S8 family peptidase n=1 Tax=Aquiflexum lacus TaxID=2483805 RepID=UPI00189537EE|nr:S8 family peptidase [Aquiflexum lacus]
MTINPDNNYKTAVLNRISTFVVFVFFFSACSSLAPLPKLIEYKGKPISKSVDLTEAENKNWFHLDLLKDTIPGLSLNRAYAEIIKDKKGAPVTVAVLDSGLDLEHEDLMEVLWSNSKEILGNGIDNDNNGYVDDVHGYNFLGDSYHEQVEYTRILRLGIGDEPYQEKAKMAHEKEFAEITEGAMQMQGMVFFLEEADKFIVRELGKSTYEAADLNKIEPDNEMTEQILFFLREMLSYGDNIEDLKEMIAEGITQMDSRLNYHLNIDFDGREKVGDDPYDITDLGYGNGNPKNLVKDESHATHVAGIIAAKRDNALGIMGVADNVSIMSIRAVPDGDEYDKDIALGIRYAVDNGAKIINASFGKSFSPNADWVYDALKYAASKDVLFVLAAGNDGNDLDDPENPNFPNDHQLIKGQEFVDNVITVGALTPYFGEDLVAVFSNFGKENVDVFAPGDEIYSTMPENEYDFQGGTSMAAPMVSGLAALIRSHYPQLSAVQVKKIIMESGIKPKLNVIVAGDPEKVLPFEQLSRSGKMVNAYNALIMAEKVARNKTKL